MRLSTLVGKTLRQPPSEAHLPSHQLLARAGMIRGLDGGLFASLPLGVRVLARLQGLVKGELEALGGQELDLPGPTGSDLRAEWVRLVGREIDSYRQLPALLFQGAVQAMPEARTRAGLFGAAERPVFHIHAFGSDDLSGVTEQVGAALERVLAACDLEATWATAGTDGQRAFYAHPAGDEDLARCSQCGYSAERSWAATAWPAAPEEPDLPVEEVETPGCDTIAALAEFLDIPASRTLKMVFYSVQGRVTCLVIRGDRSVDEQKLARVLGTDQYYASLEDELEAIGAVGGYASPIGLDRKKVRVVVDPSVRSGRNFVSGANRPDYHLRNVNQPRDFVAGEWADLALVGDGDGCPHCGGPLAVAPAFALAQSQAPAPCSPEAEYLDAAGRAQPLWMASWELDLGRLLAAVVEAHHDDYGILWPVACAPFDLHLVALDLRQEEVAGQADGLYERLMLDGYTVLYDDRDASPGVKFNDADLIGIPLRLTVSKRSVKEGAIEVKWRDRRERLAVDDEGLVVELARLRG